MITNMYLLKCTNGKTDCRHDVNVESFLLEYYLLKCQKLDLYFPELDFLKRNSSLSKHPKNLKKYGNLASA